MRSPASRVLSRSLAWRRSRRLMDVRPAISPVRSAGRAAARGNHSQLPGHQGGDGSRGPVAADESIARGSRRLAARHCHVDVGPPVLVARTSLGGPIPSVAIVHWDCQLVGRIASASTRSGAPRACRTGPRSPWRRGGQRGIGRHRLRACSDSMKPIATAISVTAMTTTTTSRLSTFTSRLALPERLVATTVD